MNGRPPEESRVNPAEDRTPCGRSPSEQPGSPGFLLEAGTLVPAVSCLDNSRQTVSLITPIFISSRNILAPDVHSDRIAVVCRACDHLLNRFWLPRHDPL